MHKKDIKAQFRKQLKTEFPNWHSLTKKKKNQDLQSQADHQIEKKEIDSKKLVGYLSNKCHGFRPPPVSYLFRHSQSHSITLEPIEDW